MGASVEQLKDTLEARVRDLTQRLKELEGECSQVRADARDAITKAKQEAMAMTLQSMVRLCVVAPTVNVHLSDPNATQQCKAPLPENRVRHIIEDDILPVFTKMFVQAEEGISPDGTQLDSWLEEMLGEMQTSIEHHLQ